MNFLEEIEINDEINFLRHRYPQMMNALLHEDIFFKSSRKIKIQKLAIYLAVDTIKAKEMLKKFMAEVNNES